MKRFPFLVLFTLSLLINVPAQATLSDEQWLPLFTALEKEDWDMAEKLSSNYLRDVKEEAGDVTVPRLRYMYLFSAAGRIAAGKMSYDDLENKIKDFTGKMIFLPGRFLVQKCNAPAPANFNGLCKSESLHDIMVTSANRAASIIHAFEYIKLKEKLDWTKNNGKVAAILGTIDSIAPNPNKTKLVIMRIYVVDGQVQIRDK